MSCLLLFMLNESLNPGFDLRVTFYSLSIVAFVVTDLILCRKLQEILPIHKSLVVVSE